MFEEVDPFELPEWLGTEQTVWSPEAGITAGALVRGVLAAGALGSDAEDGAPRLACDLFAVDLAYPSPVAEEAVRVRAHQCWRNGEVLVGRAEERLVLASPGVRFDPETAMAAIGRLARALGADPANYAVLLRLSR